MIKFNVKCVFLTEISCETRYRPSLSCRIRMTGWALPATVMDPPSLFPSTPTRLVETDGCVSTDGVRSSEFSDNEMGNGSTQSSFFCLCLDTWIWKWGTLQVMIIIRLVFLLGTWLFSVMWSTDSLNPTGGTIRATRLPLDVVTVASLSSTMTTGKNN